MKYFGGNGEGEEGRGQRWEHRGAGRAGQAVCRAPAVKQSRAVINIRAGTSAPVSAVNLSAGFPQGTILPWSCWGWGPDPPRGGHGAEWGCPVVQGDGAAAPGAAGMGSAETGGF